MEFLQGEDEAGEDVREGRKSGASSLDDESQRWGEAIGCDTVPDDDKGGTCIRTSLSPHLPR